MTSTSIDILDEETCDFYYGSISRETAEYILWDKGCLDSMFLIRKSNSDYVLSLCYQKSILHYRISYLGNGEVMLHGLEAQKFSSIEHLLEGVEGLAIKPGLPCERSSGWQLPPTYWGLTVSEIRSSIIKKSHEWGFTEALVTFPIEYLSLGNDDYNRCILTEVTKSLINKTLHEIQPWFHGRLTRLEAEKSLDESGHKEGKFLVRERDESSYALCVSHEGTAKHYRIDILSSGELAIQDGHKFPSIMSLVSHYTVFTDGLWTSLGEPCPHLINPNQAYSTNGDLILQNTLRHNVVISANNVNNNQMIGVSGLTCRHNCPQQQQQQYQLHQHHVQQQGCLVQPQSHQHQSANFYRSMSTERNRNLLNTQSRMRQPTSSIKLKDWLSNINHKWSQLISAVTPKNEPNETNRRAHHFSTLPRNHLNHHHHQHHNHSFNHSNSQSNRFNLNPQHFNVHQVLHSTQPQSNHHLINQQSIYDYAINGHQNSLNFRSLNVEINSPWINRNHNFLLNRVHSNGANPNGHNEIVTESNHYHETDLFPKNFTSLNESKNGDNGDNCFNLTFSNQLIDNSKSLVNNLTTFIPSVEGKIAKSGSNNGTSGPYLVNGLIKSSSLEDVYSTSTLLISPFHEDEQAKNNVYLEKEENDADQVNNGDDDNDDKNKDKDNNINDNHLSSSSSSFSSSILMPPIPVPRKSKPLLGLVHPMVQYANQEIIKLYREPSKASKAESRRKDENDKDKSNDDSKCNEAPLTSLNDNECKVNENPSDLLLFDEILVNNGNNDKEDNLQRSCNQQIKTLIELITDGYFNQTFKGSHWPTTPNDIKVSNVINSSSTGNQSVDSTVISSTTSSAPFSSTVSSSSCDKKCLNTLYACKTVVNSNSVCRPTEANSCSAPVSSEAPNEPVNNSEQSESSTLLSSKPVLMEPNEVEKVENSIDSGCLVGLSGDRENSDNPNYEEINEELMKEIEATRPSIEVLREFDSCFHSSEADKRRASEPAICPATSLSSTSTVPPDEGLYNRPELAKKANKRATLERSQTTATHWTSVDASGMIPMYDYDALKFDRDFIVKEASLGLSSLDPSQSGSQVKLNKLDLICLEEDPEEVNKSLTRYRQGPISLDPKFITLQKPLGNGYFGEVFLGTIPSSSGCASIQVAVKVLKLKAIPNHKSEILREAQTMSALDHKHIVRLIGVCEADPIMIVMELAPLGPLNQYLIDHGFGVTIKDIIALLLQVAMAMQYLESKQFIHRDLAARNVLLVNEKFAKVSDFGMSRALGIGKEYYKAKSASKWPLKWYAPECIYYFKFSTKSDVWSYGVTMWESLSYGQKPYEGMDGQDILRLFRENRRLPKPDNCPQEIYQLMWKCWQFRPEDRPTFAEICQTMTTYFLCSNI